MLEPAVISFYVYGYHGYRDVILIYCVVRGKATVYLIIPDFDGSHSQYSTLLCDNTMDYRSSVIDLFEWS